MGLGVSGFGEQAPGAGGKLFQPRPGCGTNLGEREFGKRPRLEVALGAHRCGGKVGDREVGDVVVQRCAVGVEELAELGVGG